MAMSHDSGHSLRDRLGHPEVGQSGALRWRGHKDASLVALFFLEISN